MSAAPVGGTMAAGALLVLDSASQSHCLWPDRAPTAPEVSTALNDLHTDTVLLASCCRKRYPDTTKPYALPVWQL